MVIYTNEIGSFYDSKSYLDEYYRFFSPMNVLHNLRPAPPRMSTLVSTPLPILPSCSLRLLLPSRLLPSSPPLLLPLLVPPRLLPSPPPLPLPLRLLLPPGLLPPAPLLLLPPYPFFFSSLLFLRVFNDLYYVQIISL